MTSCCTAYSTTGPINTPWRLLARHRNGQYRPPRLRQIGAWLTRQWTVAATWRTDRQSPISCTGNGVRFTAPVSVQLRGFTEKKRRKNSLDYRYPTQKRRTRLVEQLLEYERQEQRENRAYEKLRATKAPVMLKKAYLLDIKAAGREKNWRKAKRVLEEGFQIENTDRLALCNATADALRVSKKRAEALELLDRLPERGLAPDVTSYTVRLSIYRDSRQWQQAVDVFYVMVAKGLQPTQTSLSLAISACGLAGQWERALDLLNESPDFGLRLHIQTCNMALRACCRGVRRRRPLDLVHQAPRADSAYGDSNSSRRASDASEDDGRWERALQLLRKMPARGVLPNAASYSAAMKACGDGGQMETALGLLSEMAVKGIAPDIQCYTAVIKAYGNCGQWQKAVALFRELPLKAMGVDNATYGCAMRACAQCGQWEMVLELFKESQAKGLGRNVFLYNVAIEACADNGQWEHAVDLLDEMPLQKVTPGIVSYTRVIDACREAGELGKAAELSTEMVVRGVLPSEESDDDEDEHDDARELSKSWREAFESNAVSSWFPGS